MAQTTLTTNDAWMEKQKKIIANANSESVFLDPIEEHYYSDDELRYLASKFQTTINLSNYGPVQRSHMVKSIFIEHLGYPRPSRFRGLNRENKPKFRAQLMDIFIQSSTNLQVWNYEPFSNERIQGLPEMWKRMTYSDCRYVIIPLIDGIVGTPKVVKGSELAQYCPTRVKTIKYQATAPPILFESSGVDIINDINGQQRMYLGGKLTAEALRNKLAPLIGINLIKGTDRQVGQDFHSKVADILDPHHGSIDNGQFPDLPKNFAEVKFQMSSTIDLGMILPPSIEEILPGIIPAQITYIVGLGQLCNGIPKVNNIIVLLGKDFEERFRIWNSLNKKVQIQIPRSWLS